MYTQGTPGAPLLTADSKAMIRKMHPEWGNDVENMTEEQCAALLAELNKPPDQDEGEDDGGDTAD